MTRHALVPIRPPAGCAGPPRRLAAAPVVALALVWAASAAAPSPAQTPSPAQAQPPASNPAPLTIPLMDANFGFELQLPANWRYDRTRFHKFERSIGLLRGASPSGAQSMQILVFREFPIRPFEAWLTAFVKDLAEQGVDASLQGAPRERKIPWEQFTIGTRVGAVLTVDSQVGAGRAVTHYLCVPFDPSTIWVLVFPGMVADDADAARHREDFDRVARSLRILYDPERAEELAACLDRGKVFLTRIHGHADRIPIDDAERFYQIELGGKPIGYMSRRLSREEFVFSRDDARRRFAKLGLRVREQSLRVADDGTVRITRVDLFSAFDGDSEMIENQLTQIPAPDVTPPTIFSKQDQVLREGQTLFSSFRTNLDATLPPARPPLSCGPAYLDQAWVRLLPGLILGQTSDRMAFAIYDFDTRALLALSIAPLGPRTLAEFGGRTVYQFETLEGFVGRPAELFTDERGNMLKMTAGELALRLTPREQIEKRWGAIRDEAARRLAP